MSEYTKNLKLFKYEPIPDAKKTFSITQGLNSNWEILDGVYTAVTPSAASGNISLENLKIYHVSPVSNVTFVLPSSEVMEELGFGQILVILNLQANYTVKTGTKNNFIGVNGDVQEITTGKYTLYYEYNKYNVISENNTSKWVCGIIKQEVEES